MATVQSRSDWLSALLPQSHTQQLLLATGVTASALLVARLLQNYHAASSRTPPVMEGFPYVGGLVKFLKV
jgi:hypothetical protein